MRIYICIYIVVLNITFGFSQKNHFSFEINADFSRAFFEDDISNFHERNSLTNTDYFNLTTTYRNVVNKSFKFIYSRKIKEKSKLGLSFRSITFGLQSDFATKTTNTSNGIEREIFSYLLETKASEFSVSYSYLIFDGKSIDIELKYSSTICLYHSKKEVIIFHRLQNGLIEQNNSEFNYYRAYNSNLGYLKNFGSLVSEKLFRIGNIFSIHIEPEFFLSWVRPYLNIEYGLYSKVLSDDPTFKAFSPDGRITNFTTGLGLIFSF